MQENEIIFDLFMSLDLEETKLMDGYGNMKGVNLGLVNKEAGIFLWRLSKLGVRDLPSADDLVEHWMKF